MARPKRTTEQEWYDIFADADSADQDAMMRVLAELHRQKRRGKVGNDRPSLAESATAIGEEA